MRGKGEEKQENAYNGKHDHKETHRERVLYSQPKQP